MTPIWYKILSAIEFGFRIQKNQEIKKRNLSASLFYFLNLNKLLFYFAMKFFIFNQFSILYGMKLKRVTINMG